MRDRLSAAFCEKGTKPGRHCDGGGLYLLVAKSGNKSWAFRWRDRTTGKLRDHGLGRYGKHDVTLAEARDKAASCRRIVRDGGDPIAMAAAARMETRAKVITFGEALARYVETHRAGWRNVKHAGQWLSSVETHASELIRMDVAAVNTGHMVSALEPIWMAKPETASRVRQRIEKVLDWARVRGYRSGDNPARLRGHLDHLLPKQASKTKRVMHRAALPYVEINAFVQSLRARNGVAAACIEFQLLTAVRPGEAAGARWDEVDIDAGTWTIPGSRMKAGVEHVVPLNSSAIHLLKQHPRVCDHIFPSPSLKRGISTDACQNMAKTIAPVTCHGFRSTFRDWSAECTNYPNEVCESALAHTIKNAAEAAYRRGDLLAKRRKLMQAWADYLGTLRDGTTTVVPIKRKSSATTRKQIT
ncbi:MAG: integrase arm-type DNA-binding domain-containing protein [Xanthomonadaceae bacterium]|nr:integrase arm-type DNA-binding domain-containing protein [Xanthomonadaceae bacterium]